MKQFPRLSLFAAILCFAACTQDFDGNAPTPVERGSDPYAIPIDEALDDLRSVLDAIDDGATRSAPARRIREVRTIGNPLPCEGTRSDAEPAPQDLLHIVNYADDGGFAVLSADRRMADGVLAITDMGNIDYRVVDSLIAARSGLKTGMYPFPIDSTYTYDPKLPNPIYDGIGNLVLNPDLPLKPYDPSKPHDPGYPMTTYGKWQDEMKVFPMICSKWGQGEPCNFYAVYFGRGPYAGCGPIALSQLITYFVRERRANIPVIMNYPIDWDAIKNTFNRDYSLSYPDTLTNEYITYPWKSVAVMIYQTGEYLKAHYRQSGTSVSEDHMCDAMRNLNFVFDFSKVEFSEDVAYLMIVRRRRPVIMSAYVHNHHTKGHYWLLDGWLRQIRDVTTYDQGKTSTSTQTRNLIHCNWGWSGYGDGYFAAGYFWVNTGRFATEKGDGEQPFDSNENAEDLYFTSRPRLYPYQSTK